MSPQPDWIVVEDEFDNEDDSKGSNKISLRQASSNVLSKLARKLDLDQTIAQWNAKLGTDQEGMFDWIKLLQKIDDDQLKRIVGTDAALYLVLLKYSSIFFGVISCINLIFISVYLTGSPDPKDEYGSEHDEYQYSYSMQRFTILNVTGTMWKVDLAFFNCILTVVGMTFHLVFTYMSKFTSQEKFSVLTRDKRGDR